MLNKVYGSLIIGAILFLILMGDHTVYAVTEGASQIEQFLKSIIKLVAGLSGIIATGFIVIGGFMYIMSSGNPHHLDKAKRTITWAVVGLTVVIASYVISNIVTTMASQSFGS